MHKSDLKPDSFHFLTFAEWNDGIYIFMPIDLHADLVYVTGYSVRAVRMIAGVGLPHFLTIIIMAILFS